MNLIPIYTLDHIVDGKYIYALSHCLENCSKQKCKSFYLSIKDTGGFHCCPYGLTTYVDINSNYIFTCLRVRGYYEKSKAKQISKDNDIYNPVLNKDQVLDLVAASVSFEIENADLKNKRAEIESISHEVRKLNAQIKERCDAILQTYRMLDDDYSIAEIDISAIQRALKTIFVSSSMIDSRFAMLKSESDANVLLGGGLFECNIYKKFHKIQRILKNYQKREIPIFISGESYAKIDAYSSFEFIPLLLIENAVKYSYDYDNPVNVFFEEKTGELYVKISSYSPYCSKEDISNIFQKWYRGENAKRVSSDGSGIGLFFVKQLCDIHHIEISVTSDSESVTQINGIPYSMFTVTLHFSKVYY